MPKIAPFRATFPAEGLENQVAIDSNVSLTKDEISLKIQENPFSYYHIFKPQAHFAGENTLETSYGFGKHYFKHLKEMQVLVKEKEPALYVYQIINTDHTSFLGLISTVDIHDYESGVIKKHENTLTEKQAKLFKHIEITGFIGEPVLLTYPAQSDINKILHSYLETRPDIAFEYNENRHKYWKVQNPDTISKLQIEFGKVNAFYIADGHHRTASVSQYIKEKGLPSCSMLAFLVSDEQLRIYPFYRLFKSSSTIEYQEIIEKLNIHFDIVEASGNEPLGAHDFLVLFKDKTIKASLKSDFNLLNLSIADRLNVALLENLILKPIFNVQDSKTDSRLSFLSGKESIAKVRTKIEAGDVTVAFALAPLLAQDIFEVSDLNLIMPPKSTFVEPKLLSGSLIMEF
ncbi:MAG: DUF1015 domain-containing protein [Bacteroidia bacterium]|nr:DUF1015 domain-containing protein [Bacteroidia bacterium]MCO5252751.1 DUF1015 domain-containing protein [Bacteroidota bacterium]MCZ2130098.1 DUF1015 domain-containing protein [Bacteroidia bacterium]